MTCRRTPRAGEVMGGQGGDDAEAGGGQGPAAFDAPSHSFGSFLPLRAASAEGAATKSTRASKTRQSFILYTCRVSKISLEVHKPFIRAICDSFALFLGTHLHA